MRVRITKQRLELTWIGKDERPRLEPRILLEDTELLYRAEQPVTDSDIFDNRLIQGDNLLALKALEQEFMGKVKCVYIDPPYNINAASPHYEDGLEHSEWLQLMTHRLEILRSLLSPDGLIFVQIDDEEMPYLCVAMDQIFGRQNRINIVAVKMSEASGVKMAHVDKRLPKLKEFILIYRKENTPELTVPGVQIEKWNDEYKTLLLGVDRHQTISLQEAMARENNSNDQLELCNDLLKSCSTVSLAKWFKQNGIGAVDQDRFRIDNAWRIIQAVGSSSILNAAKRQPKRNQEIAAGLSARGGVFLYKTDFDLDARQPRVQIIFADQNLFRNPGDFWTDIKTTGGVGQEGGVLFPNGKKPEALIRRVIEMCTNPGDLVLDSFAGSGTTGSVAQKMGRRWIMVELGEHCRTHIVPRLRKVIDGSDPGGITEAVGWKGGGGFRYYRLAPSLLEKDKWDNWVISGKYNPPMLAEAVCKLMGFTYQPSNTHYWMQGHSSERDFIYITTQSLTHDQLKAIAEEVGEERSLLVCCKAFKANVDAFPNLTVRKIPHTVLKKCEWGKDDYSLNVSTIPDAEKQPPSRKAEPAGADLFGEEE